MPGHQRKRHLVAAGAEDDPLQRDLRGNHENQQEEDHDDHDDVGAEESDRNSFSGDEKQKKFVTVNLSEIRKEVQCPICLGIIRKTRTVMECLHRFCRECIDKAMRLGNNECPACRTHCASRRSLRDDKNYDKLIAYLYPDIDKFEEEELALNEEDRARNNQIQATIAQTVKRQSETSSRKRSSKRTAAAEMLSKSRSKLRDDPLRGRGNHQTDDISDEGERDSSSTDERYTEVRPRRSKRPRGVRSSQPSATSGVDISSDENSSDGIKESTEKVGGLMGPSERLSWGKGGMRSHTRHGNGSGGNGKNVQSSRIARLVDYLKHRREMDDEMDIQVMLVSVDKQTIPTLQQPYISCKPTLTVGCLCQYIALQTEAQADEIEIYVVKELKSKLIANDPSKDKLQILNKEDSLGGLRIYDFNHGYVLLGYQKKASN